MQKDVIYVDTEDDITAIIGKVKEASAKIVALVPPKRAGVLQSVVNLKLLQRAATAADRRVVLITNDHTLTALAAGLKLPVAKNLQSRPEVPDMQAPESDDEEVINGAELPVGDVAKAMGASAAADTEPPQNGLEDLDLTDAPKKSAPLPAGSAANAPKLPKKPFLGGKKGKFNIPDFTKFRNKLFLFGGTGAALVAFLVWALVIAPHASVTISAQTTAVNIDRTLTLDPNSAASDASKLALKPTTQTLKKTTTVQFAATGSKDIGNKASGTVHVSNCDSSSSFTLGAGTTFTAGDGHNFTSNAAATVPGFTGSASICHNTGQGAGAVDVAVTAADRGSEYNVAPTSFTIAGIDPSRFISASSSAAMAGGSHQMATVVSQDDVNKAQQQLSQPNAADVKNEIKKQFQGDFIIIDESFVSSAGAPNVSPAVDQPAQQAKLSVDTTYTIVGITRADVRAVLQNAINDALHGKQDQQMYSLGDNSIMFQTFQKQDNGSYQARLNTVGYIGPKIDAKVLAKQISGKRFGEIQALVTQIQGVDSVNVNFSPFWVNTAPSPDKIDISFSIGNGNK